MTSTPPPRRPRSPLRLRKNATPWERQQPTWGDAKPALIEAALKRALARPSGNWFVLGDSRDIRPDTSFGQTVAGVEVVAWRNEKGDLVVGPGACPHLGAPLRDSPVSCGTLICHWHGLSLDGRPFAGWEPYPSFDDGLLAWVRLDDVGGEQPLDQPVLPARPSLAGAVAGVYTGQGFCEPADIVANRLDPWHGAWFHPYSFVDLAVRDQPAMASEPGSATDDALIVDASFKIAGRVVAPVTAVFTAPEPRTVVMHITEGEGAGSVVETHATPVGADSHGRPRTAVVEAVVATSDRRGFAVARAITPVLRPLVRAAAGRLWRDDLAYAERRWQLRTRGRSPS
ncbi:DUF5914 domain-containing protein [Actinacidiphila glaucinigra]|uniref:DUF5914 domain-containing protein n=1 Tax=Actinacidiphila glaucinigra TaxID=235986 RepID=UPI0033ED7C54